MHTDSSASLTCRLSRSASLHTAAVAMSSSRQARIPRSAISPRLAMSTFLNTGGPFERYSRDIHSAPGELPGFEAPDELGEPDVPPPSPASIGCQVRSEVAAM